MLSKVLSITLLAAPLFSTALLAADSKPANSSAAKPAATRPPRREGTKWDLMDHGPFLSSYMDAQPKINKAVSIDLGNGATVCFDTEMCKLALGWVGGFVRLPTGRDGLEGMPKPYGTNVVWGKPDTNGVRKILRADDADMVFTTPAGPGWADADGNFSDNRPEYKGRKYGPLPREHAKWKGIYLDGNTTVLSYTVGKASVMEKHYATGGGVARIIDVTPAGLPLTTIICEAKNGAKVDEFSRSATITHGEETTVIAVLNGGKLEYGTNQSVLLKFSGTKPEAATVRIWRGPTDQVERMKHSLGNGMSPDAGSLARNLKTGGSPRWGAPLSVPGKLGTGHDAYVVDTLTVPEDNPYHSWIRCSGLDFFSDGTRAAVCSVSGDVWLLSNIDGKLDRVTWQRYATGLFQPLGLRIVDDKVYVLGRDQITRLHDLNNDSEADFYENFNNDVAAFQEYHEFALDLQVDSKGNFYFAKGGNLGDEKHPHNGCVIKVSKDGSKLETVACGLRAPNGMGIGPHDEVSVSDNQGNWVPASRFEIIKPGGFYGYVNAAHRTPKPTTYDNPVCWIPHPYPDNSSGGQVWVTSDKWGPFKGDMLHMSYGQCLLFKVLLDKVEGEYQGGIVKFPLKFDSGIMRGQFNPKDGQLYVAGLNVWQSNAARKGAVHRVRYTGKPVHMPTKLHATRQGIELTFTSPLDDATATDVGNWNVEQWNYKWTSDYGSPEFKVSDGTKGHDKVEVKSIRLSPDKKTVFLDIPTIQPVMQMKISTNIQAADGTAIKQDVWNSIWHLAEK